MRMAVHVNMWLWIAPKYNREKFNENAKKIGWKFVCRNRHTQHSAAQQWNKNHNKMRNMMWRQPIVPIQRKETPYINLNVLNLRELPFSARNKSTEEIQITTNTCEIKIEAIGHPICTSSHSIFFFFLHEYWREDKHKRNKRRNEFYEFCVIRWLIVYVFFVFFLCWSDLRSAAHPIHFKRQFRVWNIIILPIAGYFSHALDVCFLFRCATKMN